MKRAIVPDSTGRTGQYPVREYKCSDRPTATVVLYAQNHGTEHQHASEAATGIKIARAQGVYKF